MISTFLHHSQMLRVLQNADMWSKFLCNLERFCTGSSGILSVDVTYQMDPFYVTNTAYKHKGLVNLKSKENPVFCGPSMIHFSNTADSHSTLQRRKKLRWEKCMDWLHISNYFQTWWEAFHIVWGLLMVISTSRYRFQLSQDPFFTTTSNNIALSLWWFGVANTGLL